MTYFVSSALEMEAGNPAISAGSRPGKPVLWASKSVQKQDVII